MNRWNKFKNWARRKTELQEQPLVVTESAPGIDPHAHLTYRQYMQKMKNRKRNKVARKSRKRNR